MPAPMMFPTTSATVAIGPMPRTSTGPILSRLTPRASTSRIRHVDRREWLLGTGALLAAGGTPLGTKADFPYARTRTYLNNAGFHPLSVQAGRAAREYLSRRTDGTQEPAWEVSADVKKAFAALINGPPDGVGYVTSTMAGENLVVAALGIPRGSGNVVTDALHFEGSLYLYGSLQQQGMDVRIIKPRAWRIELDDLERAIDGNTKLVAVSLVSFLNGFQHDAKALAQLAHAKGAYVFLDIIQAAGAVPIDVEDSGVDFCACATYKWLMGDFGLGFLYVRPDLLGSIMPRVQFGWRQLEAFEYHMLPYDSSGPYPASWNVVKGAPGNFEMGTFSRTAEACLTHSLEHIRTLGVERIQAHAQSLVQRLQKELPAKGYEALTPPESRTPIVTF